MNETNSMIPPGGSVPDGYREALNWSLTGKPARALAMQVLSIPLFLVFLVFFAWLSVVLGRSSPALEFDLPGVIGLVVGVILTFVLHELAHGFTMKAFGARPIYGVLWKFLAFYATSPGYAFRRNSYLVIALAPLVSLSLLAAAGIALLAGTPWVNILALCAAVNGAGAIGDLWMVSIVARYPASAYVIDEREGMRVFLPVNG